MASVVSGVERVGVSAAGDGPAWQAALADAVTDLDELCRLLDLPRPTAAARRAAEEFSLLVPRAYLARIRPGDPRDPLLLQVLPHESELEAAPRFTTDPLGERQSGGCGGLLWKYPNRALIVTTAACGVHCRFCFRRHFPYEGFRVQGSGFRKQGREERGEGRGDRSSSPPVAAGGIAPPLAATPWESAIARIAAERSIHEAILSGGDPLALDDAALASLARRLAETPHLGRLRIHTRMPIVLPDRVTDELLAWITGTRLAPIVVVHVNHPREIDARVAVALSRLVEAGVPLLAQTVLLRGVNDSIDVLAELFERLVDHRVMPYYLHQLDRVAGAAHFEVPESEGRRLIGELRARLPGYAVPRYVRELPGESSKRVLA